MKELIDLLNLFCREKRGDYVVTKYREKEHSFDTFVEWKVDYMTDLYVVSKRCWFIEWLVEKDMIDIYKAQSKIQDLWGEYWRFAIYAWLDVDCLTMLLAISDEPIELLNSLLK